MAYIKRDIEEKIVALAKEYSCILITGPRQVGKTTVLRQLMADDREYVTLDDMDERRMLVCLMIPLSVDCRCSRNLMSFFPASQTVSHQF